MNEPAGPQETVSSDGDQHASPNRRDVLRLLAAAANALCVYLLGGCGDSPDSTGPKATAVTPTPEQAIPSPTETKPPANPTSTDVAPTLSPIAKAGVLVIAVQEERALAEIVGGGNATLSVRLWTDVLQELAARDPASLGIDGQQIWVFTDQENLAGESVSAIAFGAGGECLMIPLVGPDQYAGFDFEPSNVPSRWVGFASGEDRVAILDTWHVLDSNANGTPSTAAVFQDESGRLGVLLGNDQGEWHAIPGAEWPAIRSYALSQGWEGLTDEQRMAVEQLAAHAGRAEYDFEELSSARRAVDGGTITIDDERTWLTDNAGANRVIALAQEGQEFLLDIPARSEYRRISGVGDTWAWVDDEGNGWYWDFEARRPRREAIYVFRIIEDIDLARLEEFIVQAQERGKDIFAGRVFNSRLFTKYITIVLSEGVISALQTEAELEDTTYLLETGEWAQMFKWLEENRAQVLRQVPAHFSNLQSAYCTVENGRRTVYVLHNDSMNSEQRNSTSFEVRTKNLHAVGLRAEWVDGEAEITPIPAFPPIKVEEDFNWYYAYGQRSNYRIFEEGQSGALVADDGLEIVGNFDGRAWIEHDLLSRTQLMEEEEGMEHVRQVLRKEGYGFDDIVVTNQWRRPVCITYCNEPQHERNGFSLKIAKHMAKALDSFWVYLRDGNHTKVQQMINRAKISFSIALNFDDDANVQSCPILEQRLWGVAIKYDNGVFKGFTSQDPTEQKIALLNFYRIFFHEVARIYNESVKSGDLGSEDQVVEDRVVATQRVIYARAAQMFGMDLDEFEKYPYYPP